MSPMAGGWVTGLDAVARGLVLHGFRRRRCDRFEVARLRRVRDYDALLRERLEDV